MADGPSLLIATQAPSQAQQRAALGVVVALFVFFLATLPFAHVPLARVNVVVPVVSTLMALGDCISAVLLFGQFAVLRSRALLVLAGGYLFTGVVVIPYALTFPGAFAPTGLLGADLQTAGLLFVAWHVGLPIAVTAYALLRDTRAHAQTVQAPVRMAIAATAAAAALLALLATWMAINHTGLFPQVAVDDVRFTRETLPLAVTVAFSIAAVVLLLAKQLSVLDLWLLVVCFARLLDSVLTYLTETRYTGAWYGNRVIRVVSANLVLFVLLAETTRLYANLASSILAQRRERDRRTMTMDALSSAIEHEMRQPLGAIAANASAAQLFVERHPSDVEGAREALVAITDDVLRANDVLRAVRRLFTSRERALEPLDVNRLVQETLSHARIELQSLDVAVQLHLADGLPEVRGDRRQLQEVLLNLIHNATEAMRHCARGAGILRIASRRLDGRQVEITVADTGTGIDEKDAERIFEPFYTTKPEGPGMGLAICRSIVERHGGVVSAGPGSPGGSVFRVVLPSG
jgi:signal transduction histidine kinase